MTATTPLISADRLSVAYGKSRVLHEVVLEVSDARGSVGLIGESGSGKTTLARALLGLVAPTEGTTRFRGDDLRRLDRAGRRRFRADVQPVFQDSNGALDPRMRIGRSVGEGIRGRGLSRSDRRVRVAELLADVELDPALATRFPHELSGGQRQRVVIARALAVGAAVLVLDEPTSALDVTVQARVLDLLERLRDEHGLRYLLISHNLAVVARLCSTSAVLFAGRIVEEGPTSSLLERPAHPYTRALRDAVPVLGGAEPGVRAATGAAAETGCPFRLRCPLATARCAAERPELRPLDDRLVACHHAEAVIAGGTTDLDHA